MASPAGDTSNSTLWGQLGFGCTANSCSVSGGRGEGSRGDRTGYEGKKYGGRRGGETGRIMKERREGRSEGGKGLWKVGVLRRRERGEERGYGGRGGVMEEGVREERGYGARGGVTEGRGRGGVKEVPYLYHWSHCAQTIHFHHSLLAQILHCKCLGFHY